MVSINIDAKQMEQMAKQVAHIKDGVPRVMAAAINRALSKGKTVVKKEIRKVYMIKARDIPIAVVRATFTRMNGHVLIQSGMLPLSDFPHTPRVRTARTSGKPIKVTVKKGQGGKLRTGFLTTFKSGHIGIYKRIGKEPLPIQELRSIGAPIMAAQPQVGPAASKAISETFAQRLDHEIKRVLAREAK